LNGFRFKSLNAGAVLSTDLLKGPALTVRGTSSSKSTGLVSNFAVIEFKVNIYFCFLPPPRLNRP